MPSPHCWSSSSVLGPYALLFDIRADSDDLDVVDVPEVVAQIEFAEEERDPELCEFRSVSGSEKRYTDIGTVHGQY